MSTPQYPNGPQEQGNQNPDYPTQPGYPQQPNYPPQPSYPQPAYPSQPLYPQYGDQQPGFGYGAPPSQYPGQYPGQPPYGGPPPQKPNRLPLILGIVAGVVLLCVVASVCAIAGPLQSALRNARATVTAQSGTETVAATATPAEQVIYQDSLKDSSSSNGWTNDVKCPFKADGFHVTASVVCFAPPEEVADATITVTATQISGATNRFKGIAFRHPTKGNFYSFQVDALGHWFVDKSSAGAGTVLIKQQVNAAIRTGTGVANTLTVQMTGGHFVFSANGTALGSVDDSDFATGDVGLLGDDQADMLFTDLKITKPAA